MTRPVPKEYYRYLYELQAVDFVLVELTLYLDTHPDDQPAVSQFHQYQRRKQALMQQFEQAFGPLLEFGNSPVGAHWSWNDSPWPWQV
ncbi:MAG: spore coat protein CotJB [Alicyclobacillus herbarius]|uniref:spore coat protein CotJB n=1 Tax=Alicyclobacillus herbarius TaxID=122960 RepID=UPI00041E574F|nr:spore coat protein CotJB [Alicyclobacillus herbarius]MCL6633122.1 spore coat protein CotJB [Alicyclobacillus herbarius]